MRELADPWKKSSKTSAQKTRAAFRSALMAALALTGAAAGFGSGCGQARPAADEGAGAVGLALVVAPGVTLDGASYLITGPLAFTKSGAIDVSRSTRISAVIPGLPAGTGFTISLAATSSAGAVSCAGSAAFDVLARTTTSVTVHVTCHEGARTGGVAVTGTLNVCPVADGVSVIPADAVVGQTVTLAAAAHDSDAGPAPLAYHWTASGGTLAGAETASPAFTCTTPGIATLAVTVSDGDATPGCADAATVTVTCRVPGAGGPATPMTLAVYGDAPYGTSPTDTTQTLLTPAFVAAVNADPDVTLVLHVGDIHSGKQFCTEAYDRAVFDMWRAFADPLVYTPGDNEWTDCHKAAEGGGAYNASTGQIDFVLDAAGNPVDYAKGDPLANLALVRSIFFAAPGVALGGGGKPLLTQARAFDPAHPSDAAFVENVMWEDARVLFVTINLPGGSNNDADVWYGAPSATPAQTQEAAVRTAADLRWLDLAFAQAEANGAVAVVIEAQADMWDPEKGAAHQTGYEPVVANVAAHALAYGKPVLMLNGDSHVYLSHNPLSPTDPLASVHPGYDVPNFHRIVVHGSTQPIEYLRLVIDPSASAPVGTDTFGPFSWTRVMP